MQNYLNNSTTRSVWKCYKIKNNFEIIYKIYKYNYKKWVNNLLHINWKVCHIILVLDNKIHQVLQI